MATTQKSTKGTTTKKSTTASSSTRGKSAPSKSTRSTAPAAKPIRREIGAAVCLLLAFLTALGLFGVEALFIDWICLLMKGLFGYGFWFCPVMLVVAGVVLLRHRGRPIRLRLWCSLLVPFVFGALLHLFLATGEELVWSWSLFPELWNSGLILESGGMLSGLFSWAVIAMVSKWGAGIVFILLLAFLLLATFNRSLLDVIEYVKNRPHPAYEETPAPAQPAPTTQTAPPASGRALADIPPVTSRGTAKRSTLDIPAPSSQEATLEAVAPGQEAVPPKKRGFFNRKAAVPTPDILLTGGRAAQPAAVPPQEVTAVPVASVVETPPPVAIPEPELVPVVAPAPAASTPPPAPAPLPEIQREPAVEKVKKSDAVQAAAEVAQEVERTLEEDLGAYQYPPVSLLTEAVVDLGDGAVQELKLNQERLTDTIRSFGVEARIVNVTRGPSVTRYEMALEQGVKLNKITNLADDIALALGATGVRIAPIPDKISTVGIEVPNKLVSPVPIHAVIDSREFRNQPSKVSFAVGKDIGDNPIVGNIAKLPHLLIAGTTGSGKSVCTNSLIISLLYKATPEEVRLIMVDPKMVELGIYNGIPHLLIPVVTDPKKAAGALQWAVVEMMKRYRSFSEVGVRDLASYNAYAARTEGVEKMPQIVVVIDELADLMLVAAKEVEESICRVAQMGRASGMHLIIATQRPSADVITGLMKANIPSRIAFAVASSLESRIILDTTGAEKLVGRGDMLYFPLGSGKPQRVQGCLITDEEVSSVVDFVKKSGGAEYDESVIHQIEQHAAEKEKGNKSASTSSADEGGNDYDELLPAAIEVVVDTGMASVSMLQRRLKLGYARAARLVDQMEEKGIVGPFEGSKPRQLLITKEQWQEMQFRQGMVDKAPEPEMPIHPDMPPISEPVPEEFGYEGDAVAQSRNAPPF